MSSREREPSREEIDGLRGPLVLEFGAGWCGHCLGARPSIELAMARYPQVPLQRIEDGPGQPLGRSFKIKLWPTLVFLKDGQEVARLVRPTGAGEIERALAKIARGPTPPPG